MTRVNETLEKSTKDGISNDSTRSCKDEYSATMPANFKPQIFWNISKLSVETILPIGCLQEIDLQTW